MFRIIPLPVSTDSRGDSLHLPDELIENYLLNIREMHIATVLPDMTRGNHYHRNGNETLIVTHQDDWLFAWKDGDKAVSTRQFSGSGSTLFYLPAGLIHAVKNTGRQSLELISWSDTKQSDSDTCWQTILD